MSENQKIYTNILKFLCSMPVTEHTDKVSSNEKSWKEIHIRSLLITYEFLSSTYLHIYEVIRSYRIVIVLKICCVADSINNLLHTYFACKNLSDTYFCSMEFYPSISPFSCRRYALMKKCWRTSPSARPNYTELRNYVQTMMETKEPNLYLSLMADIPSDYFRLGSR